MLTKAEKKTLKRANRAKIKLASVLLCDRLIKNPHCTPGMKSHFRAKRQRDWTTYLRLLPTEFVV